MSNSLEKIICRTCKESYGEFLTLDSEIQIDKLLVDLLNECTNLDAKLGDWLPQVMCQNCVQKLKSLDEFLRVAKQTDEELKKLVSDKQDIEIAIENPTEEDEARTEDMSSTDWASDDEATNELPDDGEVGDNKLTKNTDGLEESPEGKTVEPEEKVIIKWECKEDCNSQHCCDGDNNTIELHEIVKEHIEISRCEEVSSYEPSVEQPPAGSRDDTVNITKKNKHKCSECEKSFNTSQKLQQHSLVHTKLKDFACTMCGKSFATVYRQRDHMMTHLNQRNFSCEYCEKKFLRRSHLKLHLMSHTDVRPFVCDVCGKSFQLRAVLKSHKALHEGKTAECDICHQKFSRRSHLNVHKRLHTGDRPYKCSYCTSAYMQKSHLDRHLGLHYGIRFPCPNCDKVYTKKSTLTTHIRQEHVRDQTYTCLICSMEFDKQKGFYYHMKKKHKDEKTSRPLEGNENPNPIETK